MDWAQILVIILSIFLAIFLLIGIVLGIMLVQLTHRIRKIAATAERAAVSMEHAMKSARFAAIPAMIFSRMMKFRKKEKHHGSQ